MAGSVTEFKPFQEFPITHKILIIRGTWPYRELPRSADIEASWVRRTAQEERQFFGVQFRVQDHDVVVIDPWKLDWHRRSLEGMKGDPPPMSDCVVAPFESVQNCFSVSVKSGLIQKGQHVVFYMPADTEVAPDVRSTLARRLPLLRNYTVTVVEPRR